MSGWIDRFAPHYRELNQSWSDYARELNRVAQKMWLSNDNIVAGKSSLDPICICSRMLIRSLAGFQGAIILSERGMTAEADSLTRGVYEAGFWLGYFNESPAEATNAIVADERGSQLSMVKWRLKQIGAGGGPEAKFLNEKLIELKQHNTQKQNIDDLAVKSGFAGHYPYYRDLSAASAHASLHSLHRHMNAFGDGSYSGHVMGPNSEGIERSILLSCHAISMCLAAFSTMVGGTDEDDEFRGLLLKYEEMTSKS